MRSAALCLPALLPLFACAADTGQGSPHRLEIQLAPLNLPGLGDACYDLAVSHAAGTVWSKGDPLRTRLGADQRRDNGPSDAPTPADADTATLCASRYGSASGGDLTYVGPCDPTVDSDGVESNGVQNAVTLWVDGLYDSAGTADLGAWQDPCPYGCTLEVDCRENADTLAAFDLTIMRAANQGFFDVAVTFEDIFCSAKFDCQDALLHHDTGRGLTGVLAFACAAGAGQETHLYLSDITLTCDGQAPIVVDPSIGPGQRPLLEPPLFGVGSYWGKEAFTDLDKCYWNVALGFTFSPENPVNPTNCRVTATGTASGEPLSQQTTPPGTRYPIVSWDVPVTDAAGNLICAAHALNTDGAVTTRYSPLDGELVAHYCACGGTPARSCAGATTQVDGADIQVGDLGEGQIRVEVGGQAVQLQLPPGATLAPDPGCCVAPCCDVGGAP